jgi:hypothetical protein
MPKDLSNTNWGTRLTSIGYALTGSIVDGLGRNRKYRTVPIAGGPIGYFDNLADLVLWVRQVEEIRALAGDNTRRIDAINAGILKPVPSRCFCK